MSERRRFQNRGLRGCLIALLLAGSQIPMLAASRIQFWAEQRRGANCANETVEPAYWQAAAAVGIEYIRLIPDSWATDDRDFLIGNADAFTKLNERDLKQLLMVLDAAQANGVKVVLAFFSQPGARWRQRNGNVDDYRLWEDKTYHDQAAAFWRQVAAAVGNHPAIVGYNPLNEPHPEKQHGLGDPTSDAARAWFDKARGTAADVNVFNRRIVAAIRQVDRKTPILLDGPFYASPGGIRYVDPIADPGVLYAVHFYGTWTYATYRVNKGRFAYPEKMPTGVGDGHTAWTKQSLRDRLSAVSQWRDRHSVPPQRIVVSEFGVDRRVGGATAFLRDTIAMIDEFGYHWAFYAFRSDRAWGGMDYELGSGKLGWAYWKAIERGEDPEQHKKRGDNPLWATIRSALAADPKR